MLPAHQGGSEKETSSGEKMRGMGLLPFGRLASGLRGSDMIRYQQREHVVTAVKMPTGGRRLVGGFWYLNP